MFVALSPPPIEPDHNINPLGRSQPAGRPAQLERDVGGRSGENSLLQEGERRGETKETADHHHRQRDGDRDLHLHLHHHRVSLHHRNLQCLGKNKPGWPDWPPFWCIKPFFISSWLAAPQLDSPSLCLCAPTCQQPPRWTQPPPA